MRSIQNIEWEIEDTEEVTLDIGINMNKYNIYTCMYVLYSVYNK